MAALTLACDAAARPVDLIPMQDAVGRLARRFVDGVVDLVALVEDESRVFHSAGGVAIPTPVVVMTPGYVYKELDRKERGTVSKRVMFARDKYTCQYCGFKATPGNAHKQLTLDHVKPAHLYGSRREATNWENVTSACRPCNQRKGGLLPMEAHMMPRRTPREPHFVQLRFAGRLNEQQRSYVRDYFNLDRREDIAL